MRIINDHKRGFLQYIENDDTVYQYLADDHLKVLN